MLGNPVSNAVDSRVLRVT